MNNLNDKKRIRLRNSKLVLKEIFNKWPISRAEISRNLDLNKSTISSIYNSLKGKGILEELGEGSSSKLGGRKPTIIKLNSKYGYTMSFDISFKNLHFMANYIDGSIINWGEINIFNKSIAEITSILKSKIDLCKSKTKTKKGLMGICFSIHGTVIKNKVTYSPFVNMENIDLVKYFKDKYQVPIVLENEANLTAIYIRDFIMDYKEKNLVAISIHKGIGSGIIVKNELFRGFKGEAGEIGRTLTKNMNGKFISVEKICSEDSLINKISEELSFKNLTRENVIYLYREKEEIVVKAMEEFIREISELIYNTSMYFDTRAIYIGSPLMEIEKKIFIEIVREVHRLDENFSKRKIKLALIENSDKATLLGACSVITHKIMGLTDYPLQFKINEKESKYLNMEK
ncbi:MAG: ROK family protein [Liquorilactobacillus nagelii]|uniref:ROK family protein n=1 Tax=Liquorilactobacillus nagelii TaxID=82688 RepID=UPI0039ECFCAB